MVGSWSLTSYGTIELEVPVDEDDSNPNALDDWLYARGREGFANLKSASGLRITIREDGSYSEAKADPSIPMPWFDSEGVLVESPLPTNGTVRHVGNGDFLHPIQSASGTNRSREKDKDVLRYDDGDTLVCDQLRLENGSLIRIVSVATDELYLNRIIAVYDKVP